MHHTIYLVVQAENGKDAMDTAITHIEDWGTDNNWRSAIGAISRKGRKTEPGLAESSHFSLRGQSLKRINKMFQKMIDNPKPEWTTVAQIKPFIQKLMDGNFSGKTIQELVADKDNDRFWALRDFAKSLYVASQHVKYNAGEPFDLFKHEYRPYDYDEFSVTHIDVDEDGSGKLFCVLVDMHT